MSSSFITSTANTLSPKDKNVPMPPANDTAAVDDAKKDMEYHRQILKSKMEAQESSNNYISPSDEIMSPCTAKLSAMRNKQVGKVKPKSLFAQASTKRLGQGSSLFGCEATPPASASPTKE